ncbi:MAG: alpha/beta hydrolase [Rickettsiales bacterium]|jgi:pimeloyl-ACP methyl ester carboxylesterase|nr:alpha/beta hydrolase [Rickettsiales bacterium]
MNSRKIKGGGKATIAFLHGWGHDMHAFAQIAGELDEYDRILLDLPGFGQSPAPNKAWGVDDYAAAVLSEISDVKGKVFVAGHSFGGKIALALANDVDGIFIIAGAGAPKRMSLLWRIYRALAAIPRRLGIKDTRIGRRLRGADYADANGVMREILSKSLDFDAMRAARNVRVPATLAYGLSDTATPPYMGEKLSRAIKGSKLHILKGFDHNGILSAGKYQIANIIRDGINGVG